MLSRVSFWLAADLIASCLASRLAVADEPARLSEAERSELLAARDRASKEAIRLKNEGKLAEAIAASRKNIAIERRVFGDTHAEVAGSLTWLSQRYVAQQEFSTARQT